MKITILYASLLALVFVFLSIRTIRLRRTLKIGVGDSGNQRMLRAIRAHSNFAEYVPFAIVLIYFVEMNLALNAFVHFLGITLLLGRLLHSYGISQEKENFKFRVSGMVSTFTVILTSSMYLLFSYLKTTLM
jgi:uncharacterized membrane protein YecN with MAPEG domain